MESEIEMFLLHYSLTTPRYIYKLMNSYKNTIFYILLQYVSLQYVILRLELVKIYDYKGHTIKRHPSLIITLVTLKLNSSDCPDSK